MTNREKILNYLKENGIDLSDPYKHPYTIETREWQRPGTIVIHSSYLNDDEKRILRNLDDRRFDDTCPIEIHGIRHHFEWIWGFERISLKKKRSA